MLLPLDVRKTKKKATLNFYFCVSSPRISNVLSRKDDPLINEPNSSRKVKSEEMETGLMDYFKSVNWEQEAYPTLEDFAILPLFALFFPSARFFLDRFVFEKIGRRLISGKKIDNGTSEGEKKIRKFKESAWKCVYYLSSEVLALSVTYNEPWFTNTRYFWTGPGDQVWPDQKFKLKLRAFYMCAAGFYTYSIFALIFWETRRVDFGVLMVHHVTTVILIVLSYICRFVRVGSVILALHDACDVFLEMGKMLKYSGAERIASFAFVVFVLCWILLRLVYYPFWILWSTSYEAIEALSLRKNPNGPIIYYTFNVPLFCLLIQERGKITDDVRSDCEDEDDHKD